MLGGLAPFFLRQNVVPIEAPANPSTGVSMLTQGLGRAQLFNGMVGFLYSCTGPLAIILAVGTQGGLSAAELASWVFGAFFVNGWLTLWACWRYRQPLAFYWTIPGAVLIGPALQHLSFAEIIGAYFVTGALMLVLGLSGYVKRVMAWLPMPIVMAMVAGVFLKFGLDVVRGLHADWLLAGSMTLTFLVLSANKAWGERLPPIIGALLVGIGVLLLAADYQPTFGDSAWAQPVWTMPVWSWRAMVELVIPLSITVLVVQNGMGIGILRAAKHEPPVNAITSACGVWSILSACVGSVSTCLTGPVNAVLTNGVAKDTQWTGGIVVGLLAIGFGAAAPLFTQALLATPAAFITTLGGLAMIRVLQGAFVAAFSHRFTLGALVTFLVTVADLPIWNISAAFWGLVFGAATSWWLERADFKTLNQPTNP